MTLLPDQAEPIITARKLELLEMWGRGSGER